MTKPLSPNRVSRARSVFPPASDSRYLLNTSPNLQRPRRLVRFPLEKDIEIQPSYTVHVPDKPFAVSLEHRPRRVAFLVDVSQPTDEILDAILRFNLNSWGGRHNPIVPIVEKKVLEPAHALLGVADPDVFYIYGELEQTELRELHRRYSPTLVTRHILRQPLDSHSYSVNLPEQATMGKYLRNLSEKTSLYLRRLEPCILNLGMAERRSLSRFFLWNFGYTDANFFAIQNYGISGCRPKSTSDADLLDLFGEQMNLAWPIHVCGDAPLARTANDPWRGYFPIFYGTGVWNLIAYWNDGLTTGRTQPLLSGIGQMWLTKQLTDDQATYQHFIRFLNRRISSGNDQKRLRMVSYDTDQNELEHVAKKIVQDLNGGLYFDRCLKLDSPYIEASLPQSARSLAAAAPEIGYATGKEIHLTLKKPVDIDENGDQCWMVDVHIYNPDQELWYSNAEPWWRLPRKSSLAGLFSRGRAQRITYLQQPYIV